MNDLDELIAESREAVELYDRTVTLPAPDIVERGAGRNLQHQVRRLADALEARAAVPDAATDVKRPEGWSTEDRQESKQEAERRWVDELSGYKSEYNRGCVNGFMLGAEWQKTRETFISYKAIADEARAERDAALAVIERIREAVSGHPECDRYEEGDVISCGWKSAYASVVAALDGAPEPEGRWEYRGRLQSCGYVAEGYMSAEHAMNGLKVELEDHPFLVMDDTAIVERARVREWLPVEGEN